MANKLKKLTIRKVDLVGEGANPDAYVNFFKSKKKPIKKEADSFNDKIKEKAKYKIYDQILQFTNALENSLIDIIRDDDTTDKVALMNKSLEEFYGAAGLAIESWGNGKLSDYYVSDEETPKETAEIVKGLFLDSLASELPEDIKKALKTHEPEEGKTIGIEKGVEDMKFDKSKLTPEELAQLEAIEKKACIPDDDEPENPPKKKKTCKDVQKGLDDGTGADDGDGGATDEGSDNKDGEDIFKGIHPAVKEELLALRKFREEQENRELYEVAKKYEVIGKKPEELVPMLKRVKAAGGSAYNDMLAVLDASVESFEKSSAFKEVGSNGHSTGGNTAIAKAKAVADEIKKSNPGMTEEQAMAKAWETHPELIEEYDSEIGG